jgi:hypothetical protein
MASQQNYDDTNITTKELDKLHKTYKDRIDNQSSDSDNDESNSDSDSYIDQPKITFKPLEKLSSKKETTTLYIFKKYEQLQNECNIYKNKLFKLRMNFNSFEQKQHYKNLEFSNLVVENQKLQKELNNKKYISWKYYISFTLNLILGSGLFMLYQSLDQ